MWVPSEYRVGVSHVNIPLTAGRPPFVTLLVPPLTTKGPPFATVLVPPLMRGVSPFVTASVLPPWPHPDRIAINNKEGIVMNARAKYNNKLFMFNFCIEFS